MIQSFLHILKSAAGNFIGPDFTRLANLMNEEVMT